MFDYKRKINHKQTCLLASQYKRLVANHNRHPDNGVPVVKFFDPMSACTWLVSELDPETGIAHGLCDLGMGFPEIGSVDLNELISIGRINRDIQFSTSRTLSEWKTVAEQNGNLVGV